MLVEQPNESQGNPERSPLEQLLRLVLDGKFNPSAWELLDIVETQRGWKERWSVRGVLELMRDDPTLTRSTRMYIKSLLESSDFNQALLGVKSPRKQVQTGIEVLVQQSKAYRGSAAFQEMISFMGMFREYAPYNNMLVRIQNPACGFYASASDWHHRFGRYLKEDARPMLILAPMHPVMLVYDLDQTEGRPLPKEIREFARFQGDIDEEVLDRLVSNAEVRDRIRIGTADLSQTMGGFATIDRR
ncbi:MAG TPA: hypothetical protein PLZ95_17805, partial [Bryobacteraceae bacterium]|nr:hypothetical protein [Bryobacteraceae bacterium]